MEESGGEDREGRDEISLLAEELIQLSVKGSVVVPNSKPTLICTVWTEKLYNPESFRAQMKSIWKTRKKFEIQRVGQNLFLIVFDLEEDLESIMEGRPWLFRKSIILFNRLVQAVERDQISLNSSPFWIKIDSYLPEFDKKDLLHAISVTFEGLSDLKLTMLAVDSESIWMFRNHYADEYMELMGGKEMINEQRSIFGLEKAEKANGSKVQECKNVNHEKKTSWKRIKPMATVIQTKAENKGSRGGLCLAWKRDTEISLQSYSRNHIDIMVKEDNDEAEWRFTGFYGSPYVNNSSATWNLLKKLGQDKSHPWLVNGDFNEIMYSYKKCGGEPREESRMEAFREALEECLLEDLGYLGVWFTWERGNLPETNIRERLDRGVANDKWRQLF
ncbi:hypothetical protein Godav_006107 [Gossypium davidsonii]|uniref:DUF4283 domain-containing protein n=1 Tax=Gossypium davidsonii TaxID=34287 RepID=A0A7J8S2N7_GOSDV|nr:hypothetical protein [Gossypium davidsonii]